MTQGSEQHSRIGSIVVTVPQWAVLDKLGPHWEFYAKEVMHFRCRQSMERKGWIQTRWVQGLLMARLTPAGVEIRNVIDGRRARALAREYGEDPKGVGND